MYHRAARFKFANKTQKGKKKSSKKKKKKGGDEYWFLDPNPQLRREHDEVKVKFVNTDHYQVVRNKKGWLDVKEKGLLT